MNALSQNNIFVVPVSDIVGKAGINLVYAPLADSMAIADDAEVAQLLAAADGVGDRSLLEPFSGGVPANQRDSKVNHVDEFLLMYVLPNYICNFKCSYCFSAKGRYNKTLSKEHLKAALDYFVDRKRIDTDRLAISYLGGGEPTVSWDVVGYGLDYADRLAQSQGITMMTTIVTNGSLITDQIARTLKQHNVLVRVSFEIIEEIQQKQRGKYADVCRGLDTLGRHGVRTMIRSMITPDNVRLLPVMVKAVHERFPFVHEVLFDPITSSDTFHETEFTKRFHDDYRHNFMEARHIGAELGIDVANAPLRNLNMVVERFCTGEFCLTPEGTITVCHQISSPLEKNYSDFIYAKVGDDGRMNIDNSRFRDLAASYTVHTSPKCDGCFIKWNCGGGCMMENIQYTDRIHDVICDSTRRLSLELLLERLDAQYREAGLSLQQVIDSYGDDDA